MMNAIVINLAAFDKFVQTGSSTGLVLILFTMVIALTEFLLGALIIYQWLSGRAPAEPNDSVEILK
jgi:NADH:ubiquinone oxidoreductase subunit K